MSSTEYLVWFLAMAVLIPVIVHGGTTWAYFRGAQQRAAVNAVTANRDEDVRRAARDDDGGTVVRPGASLRDPRPD